ncbi:hypothetical protein NDR87_27715 [Nocardia sp. CDC159]|uniref:Minor tail protein n=1 Tax=Nocardia pulmonis TaxID=2951408 RepID=A0A9X2J0Q6_9NOCA|nr:MULTISPECIES: hypothetical protein [Nocardia]MCM6777280.1 hypothetical protein [Nocardia pulmonis]MCM6790165.1 hypothetical protein [Nocardia sp. CDC159]
MADQQNIVFDDDITITMRGVSDSIGLPYTVNPVELVDREAVIELRDGPVGPPGPEGDPAWPWQWQGDVADFTALRALKPTRADAGKAWRVVAENAIYLWNGAEFVAFSNAFGRAGRPGPVNTLIGTAVAGPTGSAAAARILGEAPGQQLEITFPRGITGDVGDPGRPGRLQDAADVRIDADRQLGQDYVLGWDTSVSKFVPMPCPRSAGPWAISSGQFSGGANLNDPKTIAAITIPAQPVAWRPQVVGSIQVRASNGTRCDVEVRIGDNRNGDLVGYGAGYDIYSWDWLLIGPHFESPLTPTSKFGVVQPNQTVTLYVTAMRKQGTKTYEVDTAGAQLIVYAQPI